MEEVYSGIKTQNIKYEWSKNYLINQAYILIPYQDD